MIIRGFNYKKALIVVYTAVVILLITSCDFSLDFSDVVEKGDFENLTLVVYSSSCMDTIVLDWGFASEKISIIDMLKGEHKKLVLQGDKLKEYEVEIKSLAQKEPKKLEGYFKPRTYCHYTFCYKNIPIFTYTYFGINRDNEICAFINGKAVDIDYDYVNFYRLIRKENSEQFAYFNQ